MVPCEILSLSLGWVLLTTSKMEPVRMVLTSGSASTRVGNLSVEPSEPPLPSVSSLILVPHELLSLIRITQLSLDTSVSHSTSVISSLHQLADQQVSDSRVITLSSVSIKERFSNCNLEISTGKPLHKPSLIMEISGDVSSRVRGSTSVRVDISPESAGQASRWAIQVAARQLLSSSHTQLILPMQWRWLILKIYSGKLHHLLEG